MLSSSDAKWRCLWHMLVWSILMTLVSQFLGITGHVAFYIFAAISVLALPVVTSVYSNSSGRHGAGLLRASYIFCDPVLVCITITPLELINTLPTLVDEHICLTNHANWTETVSCLTNITQDRELLLKTSISQEEWNAVILEKKMAMLIIQGCIMVPILTSLLMGRRTMKMDINTYVLTFIYWLVLAIEASDLLESAVLNQVHQHVVFTTEAIVSIIMIISCSYGIVTLCSFITPGNDLEDSAKRRYRTFNFLYRAFVGIAGIFLGELPFLIARIQIISADSQRVIQGSFYMWVAKDLIMMGLIVTLLFASKITTKYDKLFNSSCTPPFDNPNVVFQPEKRDLCIKGKPDHFRNLAAENSTNLINFPPDMHGSLEMPKLSGARVKSPAVSSPASEEEKQREAAKAAKPSKKVTFYMDWKGKDKKRKVSQDSAV